MGKISEKIISATDISMFLKNDESFCFELQTLRLINEFPDISTTFGGIYFDADLKHNRQYDIQAQFAAKDKLYINLAIECKALNANYPIVVKTSPRLKNESKICTWIFTNQIVTSSKNGQDVSSRLVGNAIDIRLTHQPLFYPIGKITGRSCFQLGHHADQNKGFECNESDCYDKWTQALSSIITMMGEVSKLFTWQKQYKKLVEGEYLFLPILVVPDDTLWAVDYSFDAHIKTPEKRDHIPFFVNRNYSLLGSQDEKLNYNISHLEIMTLSGLKSFLEKRNGVRESGLGPRKETQ